MIKSVIDLLYFFFKIMNPTQNETINTVEIQEQDINTNDSIQTLFEEEQRLLDKITNEKLKEIAQKEFDEMKNDFEAQKEALWENTSNLLNELKKEFSEDIDWLEKIENLDFLKDFENYDLFIDLLKEENWELTEDQKENIYYIFANTDEWDIEMFIDMELEWSNMIDSESAENFITNFKIKNPNTEESNNTNTAHNDTEQNNLKEDIDLKIQEFKDLLITIKDKFYLLNNEDKTFIENLENKIKENKEWFTNLVNKNFEILKRIIKKAEKNKQTIEKEEKTIEKEEKKYSSIKNKLNNINTSQLNEKENKLLNKIKWIIDKINKFNDSLEENKKDLIKILQNKDNLNLLIWILAKSWDEELINNFSKIIKESWDEKLIENFNNFAKEYSNIHPIVIKENNDWNLEITPTLKSEKWRYELKLDIDFPIKNIERPITNMTIAERAEFSREKMRLRKEIKVIKKEALEIHKNISELKNTNKENKNELEQLKKNPTEADKERIKELEKDIKKNEIVIKDLEWKLETRKARVEALQEEFNILVEEFNQEIQRRLDEKLQKLKEAKERLKDNIDFLERTGFTIFSNSTIDPAIKYINRFPWSLGLKGEIDLVKWEFGESSLDWQEKWREVFIRLFNKMISGNPDEPIKDIMWIVKWTNNILKDKNKSMHMLKEYGIDPNATWISHKLIENLKKKNTNEENIDNTEESEK